MNPLSFSSAFGSAKDYLAKLLGNASATPPTATPKSTYTSSLFQGPAINTQTGAYAPYTPYTPATAGSSYIPPPPTKFEPYTAAPNMSTEQGPARGNPDGSITYNTPSGAYTPSYAPSAPPLVSQPAPLGGSPTTATPASTYVANQTSFATPTNSGPGMAGPASASASPSSITSGGTTGGGGGGAMAPMGSPATATPYVSSADAAFADYLKSLTETDAEKEAKKYLDKLNEDASLANERALNSGETMGFAGGEAQRVGRNNDIRIAGASANVNRLQNERANMTAAQKARLDYVQGQDKAQRDANPAFELSPGQQRWTYDNATGKYVQTASAPVSAPTPTSVAEFNFAVSQGYKGTYEQFTNPPKTATPDTALDVQVKNAQIKNIESEIRARENKNGGQFTIPTAQRNDLMKYGFKAEEVTALEADIRTYGLTKALEGLDEDTRNLITQQLDKQYLAG